MYILSACNSCFFRRNFTIFCGNVIRQVHNIRAINKQAYVTDGGVSSIAFRAFSYWRQGNKKRCSQLYENFERLTLSSTLFRPFSVQCESWVYSSFGAARLFSTSRRSFQNPPGDDRNRRENDDQQGEKQDDGGKDGDKMPFLARLTIIFWVSFLGYVLLRSQSSQNMGNFMAVSWNEFVYDMLAKGEVEEVIVRPDAEMAFIKLRPGAVIRGKLAEAQVFSLQITDPGKFEEKIRRTEADLGIKRERGVPVSFQRENTWVYLIFVGIVAVSLFLVLRNVVKFQLPNPADFFANERKAKFVRVDLMSQEGRGVSFKDIAGLHEAKIEVMEFVDYLKTPQRFQELGARIPRGALMLGPPGCGKTLLAKAVATEAKVPFLAMAGSEFVEMLGGLGASRVRDLFKEARQRTPCIVYIDEIDAIGRNRSGDNWSQSSTEQEHTLNQLLVEMDGMSTVGGVVILASTNRADILDKALLRPGRFDRHIEIGYPTLAERREIFDIYLKQLRTARLPQAYSERLAQLSPGMSGADIANICNEAALYAARELRKAVDIEDFEYAVERVTAGVAKKSRILSPNEKKIVAYHEAGHVVIGWLLEHTDALLRVSIIPRTGNALGFAQLMPSDQKLISKEELFERMCVALGGRVTESVIFNSVTSGAQDDLRKVTKMAYAQIRTLGMNERIGQMAFPSEEQQEEGGGGGRGEFGVKPYSKYLQRVMDMEAQLLVARAYKETEKLITENREKVTAIAEALLEKEALTYKDIEQLIGPPPFGRKKTASAEWGAKLAPPPPNVGAST